MPPPSGKLRNTNDNLMLNVMTVTEKRTHLKEDGSKVYITIDDKLRAFLPFDDVGIVSNNRQHNPYLVRPDVLKLMLLIREKLADIDSSELLAKDSLDINFTLIEWMELQSYSTNQIADINFSRDVSKRLIQAIQMLISLKFYRRSEHSEEMFVFISGYKREDANFTLTISKGLLSLFQSSITGSGLFTRTSHSLYQLNDINCILVAQSLCEHYSMKSNILSDRYNVVSLKHICRLIGTPLTHAEVKERKDTTNYRREMLNPSLKILDKLKQCGIINYYFFDTDKNKELESKKLAVYTKQPTSAIESLKLCYSCPDLDGYVGSLRQN